MNDRPHSEKAPLEAPLDEAPVRLVDITLTDRWAPLVRDPNKKIEPSLKLGQRTLASFICLMVLALILWAL